MTSESTEARLRELGVIPSESAKFVAFVCTGCGVDHPGTTSTARALAGSGGDPETPGLCWVCRRLHVHVAAQERRDREYWAGIEKDWIE